MKVRMKLKVPSKKAGGDYEEPKEDYKFCYQHILFDVQPHDG
jgi:hypothetical protein